MLWYFSGFLGYVVLAHYIRHYVKWKNANRIMIGIVAYVIGYALTGIIWYSRIETAETLQQLELSWRFYTPNVVLKSLGAFRIIEGVFDHCKENRIVKSISNLSYGIYLMHIFILTAVYKVFENYFSTSVTIFLVGIITFITCYVITILISQLPKSKYIIG